MIDQAKLPEWASWIAQDRDGSWWAYECEPHCHDSGWYENEVGRSLRLEKQAPNIDWQRTLQRHRR